MYKKNIKKNRVFFHAFVVLFIFFLAACQQNQTVTLSDWAYSSQDNQRLVFSPDGKRLAYTIPENLGQVVMLDGHRSKAYALVYSLRFSPDSKRFAYIARDNDKYVLVVDGKEEKNKYEPSPISPIIFSPDSKKIAYIASTDSHDDFVVENRFRHNVYKAVSNMRYLADGRLAYVAMESAATDPAGRKERLVIGGHNASEVYDAIWNLSVNRQNILFIGRKGNREFLVINGKEETPFDEALYAEISADGKGYYAVAENEKKIILFVDGRKSALQIPDRCDGIDQLRFLPESGDPVFICRNRENDYLVFRGQRHLLDFSYKRPAFVVHPFLDLVAFVEKEGRQKRVKVLPETEGLKLPFRMPGKSYDEIKEVRFSPDGKRLVLIARQGPKEFVVDNAQEGSPYPFIKNLVLSQGRLGYVGVQQGVVELIVDGKSKSQGQEISGIGSIEHELIPASHFQMGLFELYIDRSDQYHILLDKIPLEVGSTGLSFSPSVSHYGESDFGQSFLISYYAGDGCPVLYKLFIIAKDREPFVSGDIGNCNSYEKIELTDHSIIIEFPERSYLQTIYPREKWIYQGGRLIRNHP